MLYFLITFLSSFYTLAAPPPARCPAWVMRKQRGSGATELTPKWWALNILFIVSSSVYSEHILGRILFYWVKCGWRGEREKESTRHWQTVTRLEIRAPSAMGAGSEVWGGFTAPALAGAGAIKVSAQLRSRCLSPLSPLCCIPHWFPGQLRPPLSPHTIINVRTTHKISM